MSVLMFAGHDTTAYQLTWLTVELAQHPEVVQKVREELDRVLGPRGVTPMNCLPQDLGKLIYLNDVIKEGMRLWPVTLTISVRLAVKDIPYHDVIIPQGSSCQLNVFWMMRNGIRQPKEFIPERWAPDDPEVALLRDIFIPFSFGRRSCVGQNLALLELKLALACVFHSYDFQLVSKVKEEAGLTLIPKTANFRVSHRSVL